MIPLRVYLKGFMSYRDETELRFDGATLWVLAGRNGAGKSAIFDAITFALYGEHRGGKNNADALINQKSNNLIVEFDFAVGDEIYRVKRTLSRKRSTCQAFRLTGTKAAPQAIPDTDKRTSLEQWSEKVIGLRFETFTASALLQQNKSDLLLSAKSAERHKMIAELVDLSAYMRLHQQVVELQKDLEHSAIVYQKQLQEIEPVEEAALASLNICLEKLGKQITDCMTRLGRLSALKEQAKRWDVLSGRYKNVEKTLNDIDTILAQAEDIERKANHLAMANRVLPLLKPLAKNQEQLEVKSKMITSCQEQIQCWTEKLAWALAQKIEAQNAVNALKVQQRACQQEREQFQQEKLALNPHINKIERLEGIRQDIVKLDLVLSSFPLDLEQQQSTLQQETETLNELNNALPWLKQYAEARQEWHASVETSQVAQKRAELIANSLATTREAQTKLKLEVKVTEDVTKAASQENTRAEILLKEAEKHLAHFNEVDGQANCSYCGQQLTAEHLEKERIRLETEVQDAKDMFSAAQQHHKTVLEQQRHMEVEEQRFGKEAQKLEGEERTVQQNLRDTQTAQKRAKQQAEGAINALSHNYKLVISSNSVNDITTCFASEYPTQIELNTFGDRVATFGQKSAQLQEIQKQYNKRSPLLIRRETFLEQLHPLEAEYSPQQELDLRAQFQRAEDTHKSAEQRQEEINRDLQVAELSYHNAEEAFQGANQKVQALTADKSLEEARMEFLHTTIIGQLAELPDTWQTIATTTAFQLQKHVEILQTEAESLADAATQYEQLTIARHEQAYQEAQKKLIEQDMAQIEQDARCSISEIEQEEQNTQKLHKEATKARSKAETSLRDLENQRDRRENLESQRLEAVSKAFLYKRLAHLLGPECLQNHLLLQAQAGIVAHANPILSRISGGTLRVELSQNEEVGEGKSRTKTLNLIAYNSEVGTEALPVTSLSGSQKFRVAVGLALGIGQFTNSGTRQIESVIIDEGFGSLDKEGREEMIHELRLLKNTLRCIILVSHQEEFVDAFDNGYSIELVDGASKVSLR